VARGRDEENRNNQVESPTYFKSVPKSQPKSVLLFFCLYCIFYTRRSSACMCQPSLARAIHLYLPSSIPRPRKPIVSFNLKDLAFRFSRMMQRLTFSPLLLLLLVAPCCLSWGPFSHVQFGSDSLPAPPASQQQLSSFFDGCVSPDALKSVNLSLHSLRKRLMYYSVLNKR
jgi:hypothetical protein